MRIEGKRLLVVIVTALVALAAAGVIVKDHVLPGLARADETVETNPATVAAAVDLTESERTTVQAYSGEAKDAAELMEANLWVADDGTELRFFDGSFALGAEGGEVRASKLVLGEARAQTTGISDGSRRTVSCAAASDAGPVLLTLETTTVTGRHDKTTVSCVGAFGTSGAFTLTDPSREITVGEPQPAVVDALGGEESFAGLADQMAYYIARRVPAAVSAKWTGKVRFDYEAQTVKATWVLDDDSATSLTMTAPMGGGEAEFEKGGLS